MEGKALNITGIDPDAFDKMKIVQAKLAIEGKPDTQKDAIEFLLNNHEKCFAKNKKKK